MSKLKIKDFEGLNVGPFSDVVSGIKDIDFLSDLEKWEKENDNRKGALDAINKRQGELYEASEKLAAEENVKEFKKEIQAIDAVDVLKALLDETRDAKNEEMEQIVVERLAELQKSATIADDEQPEGISQGVHDVVDKKLFPIKEVKSGDDTPAGGPQTMEGGRPMTDKESKAALIAEGAMGPTPAEKDTKNSDREQAKKSYKDAEALYSKSVSHFRVPASVHNSLHRTKSWIAELVVELGGKTPKETEDSVSVIVANRDFSLKNYDQALEEMIKEIKALANDVETIEGFTRCCAICRSQSWVNAMESKFQLEQELSKFRG